MLESVCDAIHNYFVRDVYTGSFEIKDGKLDLPGLLQGQRFRIIGSALNDGVYTLFGHDVYDDDGKKRAILMDETFNGTIQYMGVPAAFLVLCAEISDWQTKYGEASKSPYSSESFGGYSYTKRSSGGTSADGSISWQTIFKDRLKRWRKICE